MLVNYSTYTLHVDLVKDNTNTRPDNAIEAKEEDS